MTTRIETCIQFDLGNADLGVILKCADGRWMLYTGGVRESGWRKVRLENPSFGTTDEMLNAVGPELHDAVRAILAGGVWSFRYNSLTVTEWHPGKYRARVWRGLYEGLRSYDPIPAMELYGDIFTRSVVAAANLNDALVDLFRFIEPATPNRSVYGHRLRDLLILACTEVEASWRGVLIANDATKNGGRLSTNDYFDLHEPLRLAEYSLVLSAYPGYGEISPFRDWSADAPTSSLSWYHAHQATKHDREGGFSFADLASAIEAVAAAHILLAAQWGPTMFDRWHGGYPSPFRFTSMPKFKIGELYTPPCDLIPETADWTRVSEPFAARP